MFVYNIDVLEISFNGKTFPADSERAREKSRFESETLRSKVLVASEHTPEMVVQCPL